MEADTRKCHQCQVHENDIHAPVPLHTWLFDLIGSINPRFKGYTWILVATKFFTKWVETIPLKNATGPTVTNFIKDNIICRFRIPKSILSDNGTPFDKFQCKGTTCFSSPYYPKGSGQAETSNKTILKILS
ncbi:Integrase, catalytic core [Gossypium australe]|uniref:Integrase, catalytic core n=1 Tax=Gossypium australe TaxID=47621 RepID=A0A5B6V124_9ROSI|nr:Integrase, catalytic core [Gossypium australe]